MSANSLSEEQIATVQSWADEGANLSDIQKRLAEEMDVRVTYMEMRFLIEDIGVTLKPEEPVPQEEEASEEEVVAEEEEDSQDIPSEDESLFDEEEEGGTAGDVTVTISDLQRPGMMASGTVDFGGGEKAEWYLDQFGQLGMNPETEGFRPSEEQLRAFQRELQAVAKRKGF